MSKLKKPAPSLAAQIHALIEERDDLKAIVDRLPSVLEVACSREDLDSTKGVCGSGTVACRLWNSLNSVLCKLEAAAGKEP